MSVVNRGSGYNRKKETSKWVVGWMEGWTGREKTQLLTLLLRRCYLTEFWTTVLTCSVVELACKGLEDGSKQEGNLTWGWAWSRTSSYKKKTSSYTWNNLVGSAYSAVLILRTSSQSTEVNNKCATDGQKHCSQCIEKSKIAIEIWVHFQTNT